MMKSTTLAGAIALAVLAGCQTTAQQLDVYQGQAVTTALARARFQMNCPDATGSVLSRQYIQPAIPLTRFGTGGPDRYEYTIGVAGCNQRQTMVVICSDEGGNCIAGAGQ